MKLPKFTLIIMLFALLIPATVFAVDTTDEDTLSLLDALELVQNDYPDTLIIEIQMDEENACWKFEFADGTELCVDAITGEIIPHDEESEATPEPEATPDPDAPVAAITMEEAIAKALEIYPDSEISKIELETWSDGTLVWEIKFDGDKLAVEIDATDGTVYDFGYDNNDDADSNDDHHDAYNGEDDSYDDGSSHDSYDDSSNHDSYDDSSSDDGEHSDNEHEDEHHDDEHEDEHEDD